MTKSKVTISVDPGRPAAQPPAPPKPRRGEIWLASLDKVRPVIVLTRDPLASVSAAPSYACCCTPHDLCEAAGISC